MACPIGKPVLNIVDNRINYNLLPGETLMTCPYNEAHAVRDKKFSKHVLHCHRLHEKEQAAKGAKSLFTICRFDRGHHCRNEDIAAHEAECEQNQGKDEWGDDIGAVGGAPAFDEAMTSKFEPPSVRYPAPVDEESMKAICAESWEPEANFPAFNQEEMIRQKRTEGYKIIKHYAVVGLTKSEKREFYENERKANAEVDKQAYIEKASRLAVTGGNPKTPPSKSPNLSFASNSSAPQHPDTSLSVINESFEGDDEQF